MKKKSIALIISLSILLNLSPIRVYAAQDAVENGFHYSLELTHGLTHEPREDGFVKPWQPLSQSDDGNYTEWDQKQDVGNYNSNYNGYHPAKDLLWGDTVKVVGAPVFAIADGVVTKTATNAGGFIEIRHEGGFRIREYSVKDVKVYSNHLASIIYSAYTHVWPSVNENDVVTAGAIIGHIAENDVPGNPHLHFEMRSAGRKPSTSHSLLLPIGNWANGGNGYYLDDILMYKSGFLRPEDVECEFSNSPSQVILFPNENFEGTPIILKAEKCPEITKVPEGTYRSLIVGSNVKFITYGQEAFKQKLHEYSSGSYFRAYIDIPRPSWVNFAQSLADAANVNDGTVRSYKILDKNSAEAGVAITIADPKWKVDPSGFVYEGVEENRLSGVKATVYYEKDGRMVPWDEAEEWDEANPLYTNSNGEYGWDVPEGKWQVKYEKEGYMTVYSDVLPVLPQHTEVNIGMVSYAAPAVEEVAAYEDNIEIVFDKYVTAAGVNSSSVTVSGAEGQSIAGHVEWTDARPNPGNSRESLVKTVKFVPDQTSDITLGEQYNVTVSGDVTSYAGVKMGESSTGSAVAKPELASLSVTSPIVVKEGQTTTVTVSAESAAGAQGKTLAAQTGAEVIAQTTAGGTFDTDGKAVLTITGKRAGETELLLSVPGTKINAEAPIFVAGADNDSVFLSGLDRTYNGQPQGVTVATLPEGLSYSVAYDGSAAAPTAVGTYNVSVSITEPGHRGQASGVLRITKAPVTVQADNKSKRPGEADPALTYRIISGALFGNDAWTGAVSRAPGEAAGTYPITVGTLALNDNYEITFIDGVFTITGGTSSGGGGGGSGGSGGGAPSGGTPAAPTAPAAPAQPGETEKTETQPNSAAWVNPFTDVNTSDWFYSEIEYAYTHGLFAGTSADAFSPNTPMTRGMIVTVLARLYGADVKEYTVSGFDDVAAGKYYTPYVEWAKQNGVVNGVGDNKFAPDAEITRQDLAVIITNYARFANKQFPVTLQYQIFADEADIAEYAKSAVQTLYCGNIIGGKPNNIFDPKGSATRAEVAAILHRFVVNTSV